MAKETRLAIIAGNLQQARQLQIFERFLDQFEIGIFAIENPDLMATYRLSIPLNVFQNVTDMPGYMRALEEQISGYDQIIAFETSQLASFQAMRIALKHRKPCAIIVNEFHPYFYAKYPNIRAIQVDIFENADFFLASTRAAASMLRVEGVGEEKIALVRPTVDAAMFYHDSARRKKFREYIGLGAEDIVILFKEHLEDYTQPLEVLNAFKLLHAVNQNASAPIKLVFAGNGALEKELKYRCHDLGLGQVVYFLHQNSEPFLIDLYSSCDIILRPRCRPDGLHESLPMHIMEAMSCGCIPVVSRGSIGSEFVQDVGVQLSDDGYQCIYEAMNQLVSAHFDREIEKQRVMEQIRKFQSGEEELNVLRKVFDRMQEKTKEMQESQDAFSEFEGKNQNLMQKNLFHDALVIIEDAILRYGNDGIKVARLNVLKGDALCKIGDLEGGMNAYSLSLNSVESVEALSGLGYVAYRSHSNEDAVTFFKKALARKDDDFMSILGIALVQKRIGLAEQALYWFEKCVVQQPTHKQALGLFIQTCAECTHTAIPIHKIERMLEEVGENAALIMTLGQLYLKEGRSDQGNALVKRALEISEAEGLAKNKPVAA